MTEMEDLSRLISQVEHFKGLPLSDLSAIVSMGQVMSIEKGRNIFLEGDPCSGVYVLLKGRVDLYKTGPHGQLSILSSLVPVVMFNEVPTLDGGPNVVSAVAVVKSIVWFISSERFGYLLSRYPQVATGLLIIMARHNRVLISHYTDVSFRTVAMRIARYLLAVSENGTRRIIRSQHPIKVIAASVVTSPECVSRTLKKLSTGKMIEVDRQSIQIIDQVALQELAEQAF